MSFRVARSPVVGHEKQSDSGGVFGVIEATTGPVASGFTRRAGHQIRTKLLGPNSPVPNTAPTGPKSRNRRFAVWGDLVRNFGPKSLSQTVPQIWPELVPNQTPSRNGGG